MNNDFFPSLSEFLVNNEIKNWIIKKSNKFETLKKETVKSIIIKSLLKGGDKESLKNNVSDFFDAQNEDPTKFIDKLHKKVAKIVEKYEERDRRDSIIREKLRTINDKRKPGRDKEYRNQHKNKSYDKSTVEYNRHKLGSENVSNHSKFNKNNDDSNGKYEFRIKKDLSQFVNPELPPSFIPLERMITEESNDVKEIFYNDEGKKIDIEGNIIEESEPKVEVSTFNISKALKTKAYKWDLPSTKFKFLRPGYYTELENKRKMEEEDHIKVYSGLPIFDIIAMRRSVPKPLVDWWDLPYIKTDDSGNPIIENDTFVIKDDIEINNQYQNAAPIEVKTPKIRVPSKNFYYTDQEKKRHKHIMKLNKAKENNLLIKLKLKEPEPQRIKPSTMFKISNSHAVLNPTKVENEYKEYKESRIKKHEEHNAANKLSPEERKEKNYQKLVDDMKNSIERHVFVVKELYHPLHFNTILKFATNNSITGGIFIIEKPESNIIIIESGPKSARKFKSLMDNRINWKLEHESIDKTLSDNNEMKLVFSSAPSHEKTHFGNFRKYKFDSAVQAKKFFDKYKADYLLDAGLNATFN